jgi:AraC-like DNA-binding protein
MTYELGVSGTVALRSIYIRKTRHLSKNLSFDPVNCAVINVSPLLRELILRATKLSVLYASQPFHRRLAGLIEDELRSVSAVPLQLPLPQSAIARDFARRLEQRLDACFDMQELIQECGTSRRTLERLMREETGMSLGQWVRRRKLLAGLQALTDGETVGAVAFRLSYSSPSAFIAMFKRELGMAPGEYIAA